MSIQEPFRHHEMVYKGYERSVQWWKGEIEGDKARRCGKCWLRPHQCYCNQITAQQETLKDVIAPLNESQVEVVILYTYVEIGRSANTAHLFQSLCPQICTSIIYSDSEAEDKLFKTIMDEKQQGIHKTCILFPSSASISFSSWVAGVTHAAASAADKDAPPTPSTRPMPAVRLIFLDGTYSGATRLAGMFMKAREHYHVSLPFVHLDLEGGLRSAMAGVMYQPAKDKICTFQAMALSIKQLAPESPLAEQLLQFLDQWVQYLLAKGIKHGKTKPLMSNKEVDNCPTEVYKSIIEARERDLAVSLERKAKKARTEESAGSGCGDQDVDEDNDHNS